MAGANKPDGKNPQQRVAFTRRDADRIARTVRIVEGGDKKGAPLTFGRVGRGVSVPAGDIFRTARFTGSWSVDSTNTIEFTNATFTPQTATAKNLFCGISDGDIGVAKDIEGVWHLISWEMQTATAIFVTATATTAALQSVTVSAIQSTADCSIDVSVTHNTSSITVISSTATAVYLRLP